LTFVSSNFPPTHLILTNTQELGWFYQLNITHNAAIEFSDLPPAEGEAWASRFYRQSPVAFVGNLTYAGYKDVPISYLVCEKDLVIPPTVQRSEIAMIERETGKKVDVTSIETGHIPTASQPQLVIDWVLDVARKASA
jgi:pimeloyl-ACP methyl ester carboxylesterase